MPLSLPKKASAQLKRPNTCVKGKSARHFAAMLIFLSVVLLNLSNSAGPSKNTTSILFEPSCLAIAKKLSKCQHLFGPPLPGWITTSFLRKSTSISFSSSLPLCMSASVAFIRTSLGSTFFGSKGKPHCSINCCI